MDEDQIGKQSMSVLKKNYVIDGLFLTKRITGIERYAYEISTALDALLPEDAKVELLVPAGLGLAERWQDCFHKIRLVEYGRHTGILWEQTELPRYLCKCRAKGIFLCNAAPILYRHGFMAIHDVILKAKPYFFCSMRDRLSMRWYRLLYRAAAVSHMGIITVSEFSKSEIVRYYHVDPARITVIYSAWQHMQRIRASADLQERYPGAIPGKYYFAMSSLMPNKNFKWIVECAKRHPETGFLIAGGLKLREAVTEEEMKNLGNLQFLGYVSDEDAKALMRDCRAFLSPSFYEGFGLTPLEAAACGARTLILSDIPVFHEIYGEYASYIDPCIYDGKVQAKQRDMDGLLGKFSWMRSAGRLMELLIEDSNG